MAKIIRYRDAATGNYVTEDYAKANPDTTVAETTENDDLVKRDTKAEEPALPVVPLEPYQQRVVDEKAELDVKLAALAAFHNTDTFNALHRDERDRLIRQRRHMEQYSAVLGERIDAFNN